MSFLWTPIRNSAETLQPIGRVESLYTETEKQPSASVKPVTNHGLILDGSGPILGALYFLIPKADQEKVGLTLLIKLGLTHTNPRAFTCFNLFLPWEVYRLLGIS